MKLTELDAAQRDALLTLLVAGMYADAHLAEIEDKRLHNLLEECGLADDASRQPLIAAAGSRVGRATTDAGARSGLLTELAQPLKDTPAAPTALARLEELLVADGKYGNREEQFLAATAAALKLPSRS
jgi:hypothetical protein